MCSSGNFLFNIFNLQKWMLDQGPTRWDQSPYHVLIVKWREHMAEMDKVDRSILEILQMNGRLTNAEIALRVCLSAPACWKRLERLEEEVIIGYHAHLNPKSMGLGLFAFISVTLDSHSQEAMEQFEAGVLALPNIVACHKVSGKYDYLLQVVVKDMEAFHEL